MNKEMYKKLLEIHELLSSEPVSGNPADRKTIIQAADNILVGMINCTRLYDSNYKPNWEE